MESNWMKELDEAALKYSKDPTLALKNALIFMIVGAEFKAGRADDKAFSEAFIGLLKSVKPVPLEELEKPVDARMGWADVAAKAALGILECVDKPVPWEEMGEEFQRFRGEATGSLEPVDARMERAGVLLKAVLGKWGASGLETEKK